MKKAYPYFILIFLGLILGNYFFAPKEIYLQHHCSLQKQKSGACHVENEKYALDFKISPLPINPLEALEYQMKLWDKKSGKEVFPKNVDLRILGHDMTMPEELFFTLDRQPVSLKNQEQYSYMAKRIFPTCTEAVMIWRLYLTLDMDKGQKIKTAFDLAVKRKLN